MSRVVTEQEAQKNQTQSRTYEPKVERNEKKSRYFAYKTLPSAAIAGKTPSVEEASFPNHAFRREYLATDKKDLNCIRQPPPPPREFVKVCVTLSLTPVLTD